MINQYSNFNIKHFTSTFNSNKHYNENINGFDIMVMQSHEDADKIINEMKHIIDSFANYPEQMINLEYDDTYLLEPDKKRIKQEIKNYALKRYS